MWNVVIIKSTDVDRLVLLLCSSSQFSVGHHHTKTAHAQCNQRLLISSEGCQIVQLQRNNFVSFHCTSTKTFSAPVPSAQPHITMQPLSVWRASVLQDFVGKVSE